MKDLYRLLTPKFVINSHCSKLKVVKIFFDYKVNEWQEFVLFAINDLESVIM